jgi:tRNA-Thr(GGU) m(6)t(6)A37 methyltransferase TsaA
MNIIKFKPIGVIHSPYKNPSDVPRPSDISEESRGQAEIFDEFAEGLTDLDGFSHIEIIFNFHLSKNPSLKACPPFDHKEHGVFATHSPHRPNAIGLTVVRLESIEGNLLNISGIDMVEGTPVLDIKPYIPRTKPDEKIRLGWLEDKLLK